MLTRTISDNIKFALVYGQEDRVWLQVAAFFPCTFWEEKKITVRKGLKHEADLSKFHFSNT